MRSFGRDVFMLEGPMVVYDFSEGTIYLDRGWVLTFLVVCMDALLVVPFMATSSTARCVSMCGSWCVVRDCGVAGFAQQLGTPPM